MNITILYQTEIPSIPFGNSGGRQLPSCLSLLLEGNFNYQLIGLHRPVDGSNQTELPITHTLTTLYSHCEEILLSNHLSGVLVYASNRYYISLFLVYKFPPSLLLTSSTTRSETAPIEPPRLPGLLDRPNLIYLPRLYPTTSTTRPLIAITGYSLSKLDFCGPHIWKFSAHKHFMSS